MRKEKDLTAEKYKYRLAGDQSVKAKWANFWDYHKWHVVITLLVAGFLALMVAQCANQPKYDYSFLLYINSSVPADFEKSLTQQAAEYGKDLNGDGKVTVELMDVSYGPEDDPVIVQTMESKLAATLMVGEQMIVITDDTNYAKLIANEGIFSKIAVANAKDGYAWDWKGSKLQAAVLPDLFPEDMYFSIRQGEGSSAKDKNNIQTKWQQNYDLLSAIAQAK